MSEENTARPVRVDAHQHFWPQPTESLYPWMTDALAALRRPFGPEDLRPLMEAREIDWVTKRHLIQSYIEKKGCGWDDPRVFLLDLQFHDVKRTRGLYYLMESRGLIERVVEEDAVQRAMSTPPQTTRAKVRGDFIRFARAKNRSYTVDWTYLKLNGYWEETILCMDPFSAVNRRVDELVAQVSGLRFYR